jgi:hypothetical protein
MTGPVENGTKRIGAQKLDLGSEDARVSQRQRHPPRIHQLRVAHVHDVGQRDLPFLGPVPDEQRVAGIQDLVDKIEHRLLRESYTTPYGP